MNPVTSPAMPRALLFWTAVTCGVLATLALQIVLNQHGLQLEEAWREYATATPLRLRAVLVWWILAGAAFIAGAAVAGGLRWRPPPWQRFALLRWCAGAAAVFALAHVAQMVTPPTGPSIADDLAVTLIFGFLATVMAMFGAYFAAR